MLELLHAVITSLLLSTTLGGGMDKQACADDEPANSETGAEVGKLPSHLVSPRSLTKAEQGDDDQPTAHDVQVSFCEPTPSVASSLPTIQAPAQVVALATAGRSP